MSRDQQIADKLQTVIPTLQRVRVTLRQQMTDVDAALAAADEMAAIIRPTPPIRRGERTTPSLELAAESSGGANGRRPEPSLGHSPRPAGAGARR